MTVYCFEFEGYASVHTEKLLVDEAGDGYLVKHVHCQIVGLLVVFIET
jgi:hypothetical protein